MKIIKETAILVCVVLLLGGCATVGNSVASLGNKLNSGSTSAETQREQKEMSLPKCEAAIGTVAIATTERNWWVQYQLDSPDALIKMFAAKSGCFTVLDRGRGFDIAEKERALANSGNLQKGSNIGGGQMKAADYVITPDIVVSNNNAGGRSLGAFVGAFIPGVGGLVASQVRLSDKKADVTLAVTDVRTSEQVILAEGKASKTDVGFGMNGLFGGNSLGGVGVESYANSAIGQVVALAYLEAFSEVVEKIKGLSSSAPTATLNDFANK